MSKYYSIHEFSKIICVSAQTLRNWDANGKLHPHHTTVNGYRYYSDEQLNQVINVKPKNRITIGYCRVSSHKQKDCLLYTSKWADLSLSCALERNKGGKKFPVQKI